MFKYFLKRLAQMLVTLFIVSILVFVLANFIGDPVNMLVSPKAPPKKPLNQLESSVWPKIAAGKAQKFAVSDACVGCGQCARLCPRGNIRIEGGHAVIGGNCIQCLSCLQYCPRQAISIGRITDRREHYHNPNVTAAELTESVIHVD